MKYKREPTYIISIHRFPEPFIYMTGRRKSLKTLESLIKVYLPNSVMLVVRVRGKIN